MGGPHQEPASQGSAIGALIASIFGFCLCWPFAIAALVFAIIGLVQLTTNPDLSRKMTLVAWICFGVTAVVGILYWVVYVLLMGGSMLMA